MKTISSLLLLVLLAFGGLAAAQSGPTYAVVGVRMNDVLNVREFPTAEARVVDVIPPDARGIILTGERHGEWVFVRRDRAEGWVNSRFLAPEAPPVRRGRRLD